VDWYPNNTATEVEFFCYERTVFGIFWLVLVLLSSFGGKKTFFGFAGSAALACFACAILDVGIKVLGYPFGSAILFFAAYLILGRRQLMKYTSRGIKEDSIAYVKAFEPFNNSPEVKTLAAPVKAIKDKAPDLVERHHKGFKRDPSDILQINRVTLHPFVVARVWSDRIKLFIAAFDINPAFQLRAAEWAAKGKGNHHWAPVKVLLLALLPPSHTE
jgi:hypothetical protein